MPDEAHPSPESPNPDDASVGKTLTLPVDPGEHQPTMILRQRSGVRSGSEQETAQRTDLPSAINGYRLIEELGRGGMGVVYKALQPGLTRVVALKMLHAGPGCPPDTLSRFQSEAEAIGRLQHPNIIQVHEVGSTPSGPYFVLEYAEGGSLAQRLNGTPRPAKTAAMVLLTLARAVHAAHSRGVVHRDLKPANILLAEVASTPLERCTFKISDFGLALLMDERRGLTIPGQIMGTPGYMPPEQARGPSSAVGPAADVYSLGIILYEMLTGRPPYSGSSPLETVHLMLHHDPLPPTRLRRDLPRDLETITLKCLQKEPRRRYSSAAELADDLERWLRAEPITARPISTLERIHKWVRRRPGTAALLAGASLLLAVAFALVLWLWGRAETERARSDDERDRAVRLAQAEARARADAQRKSVRLLLERGAHLCQAGDPGAGLLWLASGLEQLGGQDADLERSLRLLLGGWSSSLHPLHRHYRLGGPVRAVAWSADGTLAAACGNEVFLTTLDSDQPLEKVTLPGEVFAVLRDTTGLLAAVRHPDSLSLVRLPEGKPLGPALETTGARSVALSPDGKVALVGSNDHMARLFNLRSGKQVGPPLMHNGAVRAVAYGPDGTWVVTGANDNLVRIWSVPAGGLLKTLKQHERNIISLAVSRDGRLIAAGAEDHRLIVWDRAAGSPRYQRRHEHGVCAADFHPNSEWLASGSYDDTARVWRNSDGQALGAELRHTSDVTAVAFSPAGDYLATASEAGTLRVWRTNVPQRFTLRHPAAVVSLAASPDGTTLLSGCADETVRLWDVVERVPRIVLRGERAEAAAFSPDGASFLVGMYSGRLSVFDAVTCRPLGAAMKHDAAVLSAAYSPDGRLIATGCEDGDRAIRLWDWRAGVVVRQMVGHTRKVPALAFSPDGRLLLTGSWDRKARLWEVANGKPHGEPLPHQDLVQAVAFSEDGKLALTGGDDFTARLWDAQAGLPRQMPFRHPDKVQSVAFAPGGRLAVTGGKSGLARLWDVASGQQVCLPLGHKGEVHSLVFAGGWLWSGAWDGGVRRWAVPVPREGEPRAIRAWLEVQTGKRLDESGALLTLTLAEWEQRVDAAKP